MPIYRVEVTVTFPAWYVTEPRRRTSRRRLNYAALLSGSDFERDDATMDYTVDGVVIDEP